MTNDVKLGLVAGVIVIITIAIVFFQNDSQEEGVDSPSNDMNTNKVKLKRDSVNKRTTINQTQRSAEEPVTLQPIEPLTVSEYEAAINRIPAIHTVSKQPSRILEIHSQGQSNSSPAKTQQK